MTLEDPPQILLLLFTCKWIEFPLVVDMLLSSNQGNTCIAVHTIQAVPKLFVSFPELLPVNRAKVHIET